jgi:glucose uptake protein GlcU
MDDLLRLIIGGLAIIGILTIGAYLTIRREPKDERAESFWKFSHDLLTVSGLIALVCAIVAVAFVIVFKIMEVFGITLVPNSR